MEKFPKSSKLDHVCYDIRGPIYKKALQLEEEDHQILKLSIDNPTPFDFKAPDETLVDVIRNLSIPQSYCDSEGFYSACKAIVHYYQTKDLRDTTINDVYTGSGVSGLIIMPMQALLNDGGEILIFTPDCPLRTAAATLADGTVRHYLCDEGNDQFPSLADMEAKTTPKTEAIVVINPNNPTGAVYSKEILFEITGLARKHGLIIFADEVCDRILYDGAVHHHTVALAPSLLTITFSDLFKACRVAGFRQDWMLLNGPKGHAKGCIGGLNMLASMRLRATTPVRCTIQTALSGCQNISELILPGNHLLEQRNKAWEMVNQIPGVSCVKSMGALYMFPKVDTKMYGIRDDMRFVYDLLVREKVLLVQGSGLNWIRPDHFRIVTLPHVYQIEETMDRLERFLHSYRQ